MPSGLLNDRMGTVQRGGKRGCGRTLGTSREARDVGRCSRSDPQRVAAGPRGQRCRGQTLMPALGLSVGSARMHPALCICSPQMSLVETKSRRGKETCPRPPSSASPVWGAAGSRVSPGMLSPSLSGCLLAPRMGNLPEAKVACLPARYKLVELLCYVGMGFFPALAVLSMVSPACPAWGLARSGKGPSPSPEAAKSSPLL